MRSRNNLSRMYGPMKVAGDEGIETLVCQTVANLFGLTDTSVVKLTLNLSLHHLSSIVDGLSMTYQI